MRSEGGALGRWGHRCGDIEYICCRHYVDITYPGLCIILSCVITIFLQCDIVRRMGILIDITQYLSAIINPAHSGSVET
jgi:hypothetical protein